ncbi:hypothetical protein TOPH_03045 [Tolypocladium ophioglossoides CBS 100239]|uniref:Uncharacterized protein n=1 Tax=Tolypocladium ophioglossoides (strain CBS 100239) TaxID=1163406 RepID=A0A0L0NEB1_TOLOC|nr:hypothetical protein TOPH_03045 [Tolypocladium ophioglossoides CBS 100239]
MLYLTLPTHTARALSRSCLGERYGRLARSRRCRRYLRPQGTGRPRPKPGTLPGARRPVSSGVLVLVVLSPQSITSLAPALLRPSVAVLRSSGVPSATAPPVLLLARPYCTAQPHADSRDGRRRAEQQALRGADIFSSSPTVPPAVHFASKTA